MEVAVADVGTAMMTPYHLRHPLLTTTHRILMSAKATLDHPLILRKAKWSDTHAVERTKAIAATAQEETKETTMTGIRGELGEEIVISTLLTHMAHQSRILKILTLWKMMQRK